MTFIRITPIILAWRFVFVKLHEFIINVQCRVHENCMCLYLELTLCQALYRLALLHSKQHFSGIQPLDKLEPEKGVPPQLICEPTPRLGYWEQPGLSLPSDAQSARNLRAVINSNHSGGRGETCLRGINLFTVGELKCLQRSHVIGSSQIKASFTPVAE